MNNPCPNRVVCPVGVIGAPSLEGDDPILNLSSEAIDGPEFRAISWPTLFPDDPFTPDDPTDPPTLCTSSVSQDEAQLCSDRGSTGNHPGPPGTGPAIFLSAIQTCPYLCPDGTFFFQTVGPGAFLATSQSLANQQAAAYACQLAAQNVFCLSDPATACCNSQYQGKIVITGGNGPFTPEIIGGSLPPGISVSQSSDTRTIFLNGTPSGPGNFSFALSVQDGLGNFKTKTITVKVLCVQGQPSTGQVGTPYSFQFQGSGGDGGPYSFKGFQPPPPPGLGILPDGTLAGTPQGPIGTFPFGVGITDKNGNTCGMQATITIVGACNQDQAGTSFCPANPGITTHIDVPAGTFCGPVGTNQNFLDSQAQQSMLQQLHDAQAAKGCLCPGPTMSAPSASQSGVMNNACGQFWVTDTVPPGPVFVPAGPFDWVNWWEVNNGIALHGHFHAIPFDFAGPSLLIFKV